MVHRKESNTKEGSSGGSEDQKNGIRYIEIKYPCPLFCSELGVMARLEAV